MSAHEDERRTPLDRLADEVESAMARVRRAPARMRALDRRLARRRRRALVIFALVVGWIALLVLIVAAAGSGLSR